MADLLFDTPWWLPTALVAIGLALFFTGNSRMNKGLRTAGLAVVLAGVLIGVVSYLVDTDKETVAKRARQLVQSAGQQDWTKVQTLMSPGVQFNFEGRHYGDRDTLIQNASSTAKLIGLHDGTVTSLTPEQSGSEITTGMRIFTTQDKTSGTELPSDWKLTWKKEGGQWVVTEIRLIQVGQLGASEIQDQRPK
jgi:hypothetical protein